jgi:hypothetical protein
MQGRDMSQSMSMYTARNQGDKMNKIRSALAILAAAGAMLTGCDKLNDPVSVATDNCGTCQRLTGTWFSTTNTHFVEFNGGSINIYADNTHLSESYTYRVNTVQAETYSLALSNGGNMTIAVKGNSFYLNFGMYTGWYQSQIRSQ